MSIVVSGATYASIVANLAATLVYLFVGYRLYQRPVSPGSRLASVQFSIWWGGWGVSSALTAFQTLFYVGHALNFPLALTFEMLDILIVTVFLWGLVGFLVYVYSGKYYLGWVSAYFGSFYVITLYYILSEMPYAVTSMGGIPNLAFASTGNLGLGIYAVLGIIGPEISGAILYLTLLRRTKDPTRRFRIALIGSSILLWFGLLLLVPSSTATDVLIRSGLEFIPPLMALLAYFPPSALRARWGLTAVGAGTETAHEVAVHP